MEKSKAGPSIGRVEYLENIEQQPASSEPLPCADYPVVPGTAPLNGGVCEAGGQVAALPKLVYEPGSARYLLCAEDYDSEDAALKALAASLGLSSEDASSPRKPFVPFWRSLLALHL